MSSSGGRVPVKMGQTFGRMLAECPENVWAYGLCVERHVNGFNGGAAAKGRRSGSSSGQRSASSASASAASSLEKGACTREFNALRACFAKKVAGGGKKKR